MPWKACISPMSSSQNSSSSSDRLAAVPLTPLHDVVCTVDVILGSSSMSVRDCLNLQPNAIVKLGQSAGDEMQVVINGISTGVVKPSHSGQAELNQAVRASLDPLWKADANVKTVLDGVCTSVAPLLAK